MPQRVERMNRALVLLCIALTCGAQKWKPKTPHWDAAEHDRTCSNLTQVLDNWKFAILSHVKDLLINDHASVLPEYNRIQPLSEALGDLYRLFNALKDELGGLTKRFDPVEAFVEDVKGGKFTLPRRSLPRFHPRVGLRAPLRAQMRAPKEGTVMGSALVPAGRRGLQRP